MLNPTLKWEREKKSQCENNNKYIYIYQEKLKITLISPKLVSVLDICFSTQSTVFFASLSQSRGEINSSISYGRTSPGRQTPHPGALPR